jgi:hypothetical protein
MSFALMGCQKIPTRNESGAYIQRQSELPQWAMNIKLLRIAARYAPGWAYKIMFERWLRRENERAWRELRGF